MPYTPTLDLPSDILKYLTSNITKYLMLNIVKYLTSSDVNYMPKLSACALFAQGFSMSTIFLTGFTKNGLTLKTLWPNPSHAPYLDEYSSQKCLLAEGWTYIGSTASIQWFSSLTLSSIVFSNLQKVAFLGPYEIFFTSYMNASLSSATTATPFPSNCRFGSMHIISFPVCLNYSL